MNSAIAKIAKSGEAPIDYYRDVYCDKLEEATKFLFSIAVTVFVLINAVGLPIIYGHMLEYKDLKIKRELLEIDLTNTNHVDLEETLKRADGELSLSAAFLGINEFIFYGIIIAFSVYFFCFICWEIYVNNRCINLLKTNPQMAYARYQKSREYSFNAAAVVAAFTFGYLVFIVFCFRGIGSIFPQI